MDNVIEWRKKKPLQKKAKKNLFSLSDKLRKDGKISEEFEIMFNNLSLEEVIGLKLELAAKSFHGGLFGFPLWYSLNHIIKDAVLKYVWSMAEYSKESWAYLGLKSAQYYKLLYKFKPENYFLDKTEIFDEDNKKMKIAIRSINKKLRNKFKKSKKTIDIQE